MGVLGVLVSFKITRGIKLVVGRVTEGVKGSLKAFWGCLRRSGGSKGVCLTPVGHVLPLWKSFRALNLVPNTIKWSNWPMFTRQASLTHFWTFGALLDAPKRPFYEQIKAFWNPRRS